MILGFFSKDDPRETGISNPGLVISAKIRASSPSLTFLDILLATQDESEREVRENSQRI